MLYLLDANVFIDAKNKYYSFISVPEYWTWLIQMGKNGHVKIPFEIYKEITEGEDDLEKWAKEHETKKALLLEEEVDSPIVTHVTETGYATDLTEDELEQIDKDSILIAYAFSSKEDRCVVTTENSKPGQKRAKRRIPDVCNDLGVQCCDPFQFSRALNFRTNWKIDI